MRSLALLSPFALIGLSLISNLPNGVSAQQKTSGAAANMSLCDKYSTALFKSVNATAQSTLLTALVNTVVIGSYSPLGDKLKVPGILANGTFNDQPVSLLKYFDGSLKSTNVRGVAQSVNFLDGGGAEPLKNNKPANDTTSAQYVLMTHLYQYFGAALGCSSQSDKGEFPTYQGTPSMSAAHRFMNLDANEVGYFITQVGMAAVSFGVSTEDATAVGTLLGKMFNVRCAPAIVFPPPASGAKGQQKAASQSICLAASCPLADTSDCKVDSAAKSYPNGTNGVAPQMVMGGSAGGNGNDTAGGGSGDGADGGSESPASGASPAAWIGSLATLAALGLGAFAVATLL
ncbi:hypothetical protein BCV69DRAFT_310091 [Microstroma glucosiphilum]|uniref:Heme haloperoxidase family profile domain-containing protein n=1 Tax=Pseudomicrostroma glucosiphilum TaxID=1684307 RepID=A0A316UG72_9BASI|nr:hypothetical protein BCV69DRAFT_310091 [Pseudomicrostroma glucosiphilum]PWN24262.1 hypothetical protein BCV69DRAFT_310091 [Pseudomicrostroma glucosiphilum]